MKEVNPIDTTKARSVYNRMVDVLFGYKPLEDLPGLIDSSFLGYGTAAHESFKSREDVMNMARMQTEQLRGQEFSLTRKPVSEIALANGDLTLIVEEFGMHMKANDHRLSLRLTTLLEKTAKHWKIIHFHGSTPDSDIAEEEAFPMEGLKRKNEELEARIRERTRELEIEAALERVRASSMGMKDSEELSEVLAVLFQQFDVLGINPVNVWLSLFDLENNTFTYRATGTSGKRIQKHQVIDLDAMDIWKDAVEQWKNGTAGDVIVTYYPAEILPELLDVFKETFQAMPEDERISAQSFPEGGYNVQGYCQFGYIGYNHTRQPTQEEKDIVKKFAAEFGRVYQRFLDLQKAEAQTREAEIEAALERVRSRSMAMHKSEELTEVATVLYKELITLEVSAFSVASIVVFDEPNNRQAVWGARTGTDSEFLEMSVMPLLGDPVLQEIYNKWLSGEAYFSVEVGGLRLKNHKDFVFPQAERTEIVARALENMPDPTFFHCAVFSSGYLELIADRELPDESALVLKRFAKVFEQTYTRFLDLQKAEAQAREAQIEAALERVRSSMMAMHKTEELHQVLGTVMTQLQVLGFPAEAAAIIIIDKDLAMEHWMTGYSGDYPESYKVPYVDHPYFTGLLKGWQEGIPFKEFFYEGELKIGFSTWLLEHSGFRKMPPEFKKEMLNPVRIVLSEAYNKYGMLEVISQESLPEDAQTTLKRFSKVFEQAYTRFLDLKKAEEQARESNVQLALERVRARTMAMHGTDELRQVISTIFEQMMVLDLNPHAVSIALYNDDKSSDHWFAGLGHMELPNKYHLPFTEHPYYLWEYNGWKAQVPFDELIFEGNKKVELAQWVLTNGDFGKLPKEFKNEFLDPKAAYVSNAYMKYGFIEHIGDAPSDEILQDLLKRFAKVFEQTYTRFLDLQKAEAQAREAKIEVALERVRAGMMAMHKSDELRLVIKTIFEQLQELDFGADASAVIIYDENYAAEHWFSGYTHETYPKSYTIPYIEKFAYNTDLVDAWRNGVVFQAFPMEGTEKTDYGNWLLENTDFKDLPEEFTIHAITPDRLVLNDAFNKYGMLEVLGPEELAPENTDILIRFSKVFEQTYTRFLDLKKAEAQAREAQIETALERVRSRTMGMHESQELRQVVDELYDQFRQLDLSAQWANIMIFREDLFEISVWLSDVGDHTKTRSLTIKGTGHWSVEKQWDIWKNQEKGVVQSITGEEKRHYDDFMFSQTDFASLPDSAIANLRSFQEVHYSFAPMSCGLITAISHEVPLRPGEFPVLERFAAVFDQAYTRYLDLKKAEAQAREAKVEAALERVRSRSMAMHKSEELAEVATVLYNELIKLEVSEFSAASIVVFDERNNQQTVWGARTDSEALEKSIMPLLGDQILQELHDKWSSGEAFFTVKVGGIMLKNHIDFVFPRAKRTELEDRAMKNMPDPTLFHCAAFSMGYLELVSGRELAEESASLLIRFAKVFDQTYTRFLDLQKAEAQAREAQIEMAMERVRSRSMAMQTSEELNEVIRVIFDQLALLNIHAEHAGIVVDYSPGQDWNFWVADKQDIPSRINVPYLDLPWDRQFTEAKKNGTDFFTTQLNFEEKNSFYQKLLPHIPGVTREAMDFYFSCPGLAASTVLQEDIALYIENFSGTPYSEDDNSILRRFGKVFQQTYTRFLDLKKAEEQAREARIEAALEKVRSRTMAMQHSDELPEAANILFLEVQALGIPAWSCGYNILAPDKKTAACIMSSEGTMQSPFTLRLSGEASFDQWGKFIRTPETFLVQELGGKALTEHYEFMKSFPDLEPIFAEIKEKGLSLPTHQINHLCKFTHGFLLFITYEPVTEAHDLFKRFTRVFEQTYTRFLDLKKMEERAREARIETALERVRARAMAMQQPEELMDVAQVLRGEMGLLGVEELETCSIYINDVEARKAECWYAIKDIREQEKIMVADHFALDLKDTWVGRQMLQFYESDAEQVSIVMKGEQRREWIDYCEVHSEPFRGYYGEVIPERTYHLYKFSHGAIGVATDGDLSHESWRLLRRAASVFSLAYSRFRDLTQARLDLQRLKEEKKRAEDALAELQLTQKQLVHAEKMASLGELTAGIAHEIQNPLNFVNNFSEVSRELLEEMIEELKKGDAEEADAIARDVIQNLEKIVHHGKRADGIVKGMLQHSRSGDGQKQPTDLNRLADEYLRLAYHGLRAKDKAFNANLETDFDPKLPQVSVVPQDIGRVLLNLLTNAFHAVSERKASAMEGYEPTVWVTTRKTEDGVEISVRDNGHGIPENIREKIFQPFFTTKPTGQGTGLGLSMSYDIVTKGHGGKLEIGSKAGEGTEFIVTLPV